MQVTTGWRLVKLPEHENTQLVAFYMNEQNYKTGYVVNHNLATRQYIEVQHVYSTWVEDATDKLVYMHTAYDHTQLRNKQALAKTHSLIGLGKYALRHFS